MASLTQWTWVWARSGSWWWTGKPGVLQSMGSQSWTRLSDWTIRMEILPSFLTIISLHLEQYLSSVWLFVTQWDVADPMDTRLPCLPYFPEFALSNWTTNFHTAVTSINSKNIQWVSTTDTVLASLSFTISQSLLKVMSTESVIYWNLLYCHSLLISHRYSLRINLIWWLLLYRYWYIQIASVLLGVLHANLWETSLTNVPSHTVFLWFYCQG